MNGRIYDPLLGRFLSADRKIDGAFNLQGYNRYSYVHNNPLTFNDPSGYSKGRTVKTLAGLVFDSVRSFKVHRANVARKQFSPRSVITHAENGRALVGGRPVDLPKDAKLGQDYTFVAQESGKAYNVPISKEGFVNFSEHRVDKVDITMSGDSKIDMKLADEKYGKPRPDGYTWHHNENGTTMELVPSELNNGMPHTGGNAVTKAMIRKADTKGLAVVAGIIASAIVPNTMSATGSEESSTSRTMQAGIADLVNLADPMVQDVLAYATNEINGAIEIVNIFKDEDIPSVPVIELADFDEFMHKDEK